MIRNLLLFVLLAGLSGCQILGPSHDRAELQHNQQRWATSRPAIYEFHFRKSCFCSIEEVRPMRVTVSGLEIRSARDADTDEAVDPGRAHTVDDLFAIVRRAQARNAHQIDVTYHPDLGYPTSIIIDYNRNTADDEMSYWAAGVRAVP